MENPIYTFIKALLVDNDVSDVHIHNDRMVVARISGDLIEFPEYNVSQDHIESFLKAELSDVRHAQFVTTHDVDFAYQINDYRFRGSALKTKNGIAIISRVVESKTPNINDLDLPPAIHECLKLQDGLVLVTGATGAGKSTSLAAMIDKINRTRSEHIVTIEDPVEFIHKPIKSIITQREVGSDTATFASALKGVLRQDPDVILMGELRDYESVSMAMSAAETGHLVFATLHTNGAAETVNRLVDMFPADEQIKSRAQLSMSLRLVMTQQLLKRKSGGRIAAFEVMVNTPGVANLIRENKISQIANMMQTGVKDGMILLDKYKETLLAKGLINREDTQ